MSLYSSEYEMKIPFYDIDPMGVVWHGNYIKYLEEARCDMFKKLNYTYRDMKNDFYAYPIAKLSTKFIKPAFFEEEIIIKSEITEIEPSLIIKYKIFDKKTNEKIFVATTMQIGIDIKSKESIYSPPKRLMEILEKINNEK